MENLRIYFATYNVGTSSPDQSLLQLLSLSSNPKNDKTLPDFYVIGLQEVRAQPHNLLMDTINYDPWTRALREVLSSRDYIKLSTIRLQGLVLNVFCAKRHLLNVHEIETNYTRTGLAGMWGNKGAVSTRLSIYGCSICFVNAHLCAHDNQLEERIVDFDAIVKEQEFNVSEEHKLIFYHDYVFWMGDLNFRLNEDFERTPEEIDKIIKSGNASTLYQHDQLKCLMDDKKSFDKLTENPPSFPPTFKFEVGEVDIYDHKRRPAWTDRILYAVHKKNYENVTLQAEQKSYNSYPDYVLSDHKPVSAEFVIKVFDNYGVEHVKFDKIKQWWDNEENSIIYEVLHEVKFGKDDWIGVYRATFDDIDEYEAYEYVAKNRSPVMTRRQPKPVNKRYRITFSQPSGKRDGLFRLIYIREEDKVRSVLGISDPFPIVLKEDKMWSRILLRAYHVFSPEGPLLNSFRKHSTSNSNYQHRILPVNVFPITRNIHVFKTRGSRKLYSYLSKLLYLLICYGKQKINSQQLLGRISYFNRKTRRKNFYINS